MRAQYIQYITNKYTVHGYSSILTAITLGSRLLKASTSILMFWLDSATTSDRGAPPISRKENSQ